jgi:hypothetical protein
MTTPRKITCVACKGGNICFGYVGTASNTFVPSGIFSVGGYRIRSYVCLECGHMGQYLPEDKINKLKEKLKNRYG